MIQIKLRNNRRGSLTSIEISSCYQSLAAVAFAQHDFGNSLKDHFKYLEIYKNTSPSVPQFLDC
jgi:hypothetical protein